jgi:hypothetical protein
MSLCRVYFEALWQYYSCICIPICFLFVSDILPLRIAFHWVGGLCSGKCSPNALLSFMSDYSKGLPFLMPFSIVGSVQWPLVRTHRISHLSGLEFCITHALEKCYVWVEENLISSDSATLEGRMWIVGSSCLFHPYFCCTESHFSLFFCWHSILLTILVLWTEEEWAFSHHFMAAMYYWFFLSWVGLFKAMWHLFLPQPT